MKKVRKMYSNLMVNVIQGYQKEGGGDAEMARCKFPRDSISGIPPVLCRPF